MRPEDEQKLTAYALGELEDAEQANIEALLKESPEAQAELDAIRETANLLKLELGEEACPELTPEHAAAVLARAEARPRRRWLFVGLAMAASLALLAGSVLALWHSMPPDEQSRLTLAKNEQELGSIAAKLDSAAIPADTQEQLRALGYLGGGESDKERLVYIDAFPDNRTNSPAKPLNAERAEELARSGVALTSSAGARETFSSSGFSLGDPTQSVGVSYDYSTKEVRPGIHVGDLTDTYGFQTDSTNGAQWGLVAGGGGYGGGYGGGGYGYQGGGMVAGRADTTVDAFAETQASGFKYDINGDGTEETLLRLARAPEEPRPPSTGADTSSAEAYARIVENPFLSAAQQPLSTFSIDVDTASYANVRRFLTQGQWPHPDAVRIEELINYFTYDYAPPTDNAPFAVHSEVTGCPWTPGHRLVRIGLKGREIDPDNRKPCTFVFLLDVSGSMEEQNKLPLLKKALNLLVDGLGKDDKVALVTFADEARLHLSPTTCDQKQVIKAGIDELNADGSTNGGAGLELAYDLAKEHAVKEGNNRVIVGTDGDFNQGVTEKPELVNLIQDCAKSGIFLTVLGFGEGNLQDSNLETLADKGNGNYSYIDSFNEARRVLCQQMAGTLVTIAKDVKLQVEFNPGKVSAYRLIGYENRALEARDFNDDRKDAGDIGSGHTVTALYEVVPVGVAGPMPGVDNLRFQQAPEPPANLKESDALLYVKLRYKEPNSEESALLEFPLTDSGTPFEQASADTRFAAAVAEFGMLLRDSDAKGNATFGSVLEIAHAAKDPDPQGYRAEFMNLVTAAQSISGR